MPRSPSPTLNSPHNPPVEPETQSEQSKRKKKDLKITNDSTLSTSSSSSSDEADVQQEKQHKPEQGANEAENDTTSALQNEIPKEEKVINYKSDESESRKSKSDSAPSSPDNVTTEADSDKLKDADSIESGNKGDITPPPPSSDTVETSKSPSKSSDDSEHTEDKTDTSTSPDSTTPATDSPPIQPTISITVVPEPAKIRTRGRAMSGKIRPMFKSRPQASGHKRLKSRLPAAPKKPETTPPKEGTTTTVTEAQAESEETVETIEKTPVNICKREIWRARATKYKDVDGEECYIKLPARGVVFVTNTEVDECTTMEHCAHEVRKLQAHHMDKLGLKDIAYNWVMGGDQVMYEGLGWDCRSPAARNKRLNSVLGHHIYIGFLGRYAPEDIPTETLNQALAFIYLNMKKSHIIEDYKTQVYEKLVLINDREYDILPYL